MRMTITPIAFVTVIALLVFRPSPSLSQQGDCSAQVTVTETARQPDAYGATFKYRINATSDAPSAVVHFKLARTFDVNGSPYSQAEPWSVVVRGGQDSDDGEVRESSSPRQIQWSVTDVFMSSDFDGRTDFDWGTDVRGTTVHTREAPMRPFGSMDQSI
jgi:hypothetical protein